MASYLPAGIESRDLYFKVAFRFLVRYEWLYNFPVTEILSSGVLEQLPLDWWCVLHQLSVEELNKIPKGVYKESWPESLKQLIHMCYYLRLPIADQPVPPGAPIPDRLMHALGRGMSPKKMHEVTRLAGVISEICSRARVNCIVDMGCGLGYLCEVLHFVFGFRVIGLEVDPRKVARATERHTSTCRLLRVQAGGVRYVECDVTDSTEPIQHALSEVLDSDGNPAAFCLVGLHSCGDLTPHAVHLFHRIDQITNFVLVTCCYHRMEVDKKAPYCRVKATGGCQVQDGEPESTRRRVERQLKSKLALEWLRRSGGASLHDEDVLGRWLDPVLARRAAPAPEHFFKFPLSLEMQRAARSGPIKPWALDSGLGSRSSLRLGKARSGGRARPARRSRSCGGGDAVGEVPDGSGGPGGGSPCTGCTCTSCTGHTGTLGSGCSCTSCTGCTCTSCTGLWACQFLRRPLLRLACNETVATWERKTEARHAAQSVHMMARAVLQLYATANKLELGQRGACLLHNEALGMLPHQILADMVDRLLASLSPEDRDRHKKALVNLYGALDPLRPLLDAVIGLQVALQHVCEGLILVDRLAALAEDVPSACILRVADPLYSPRCYALVAEKNRQDAGSSR